MQAAKINKLRDGLTQQHSISNSEIVPKIQKKEKANGNITALKMKHHTNFVKCRISRLIFLSSDLVSGCGIKTQRDRSLLVLSKRCYSSQLMLVKVQKIYENRAKSTPTRGGNSPLVLVRI